MPRRLLARRLETNCDFPNKIQDTESWKALLHCKKHLCVVAAFFSRNILVHTRHNTTVQQRPNDVELFKDNGQPLKVLSAANTIIRITSPMVGDRGLRCVSSEPFENESIGGNRHQGRAGDHLWSLAACWAHYEILRISRRPDILCRSLRELLDYSLIYTNTIQEINKKIKVNAHVAHRAEIKFQKKHRQTKVIITNIWRQFTTCVSHRFESIRSNNFLRGW